jgi:two-component system, OmpR family, sensor kinase
MRIGCSSGSAAQTRRARTSGGTGLGLSIVDSLVCAHRGKVTVTTVPGPGRRFTVSLPRIANVPAGVR